MTLRPLPVRPFALALTILCSCAAGLAAQASMQPTPRPATTAENEDWYVSGAPIAYGGNVYYQAGAVIHFLRNEMVMTGMFEAVPIYVRTTQEPGSVIYVPLQGGLMRPYERRRTGDLAGTVGSSAPGFPVALRPVEPRAGTVQAPRDLLDDEPVGTSGFVMSGSTAATAAVISEPVGTGGAAAMLPPAPAAPLAPLETARRPAGINGLYLEYGNARWFANGRAVEFNPRRFTRIGEYRGFPVYATDGEADTIYVSLLDGAPGLLTPYTTR
jgi:hypothetical protein